MAETCDSSRFSFWRGSHGAYMDRLEIAAGSRAAVVGPIWAALGCIGALLALDRLSAVGSLSVPAITGLV
eukprot:7925646-Pyramimonas_sp.AAC.1